MILVIAVIMVRVVVINEGRCRLVDSAMNFQAQSKYWHLIMMMITING